MRAMDLAAAILIGTKRDEVESSASLLYDVEPLVEHFDAGADVVGMGGIPHAKEQGVAAAHICSGHTALHGLELAKVEDDGSFAHGTLELCHPLLHALVGDVSP